MTSIEVLSKPGFSSKNKKNLEAGRRKLEEFRKKKAQSKNGKSKNQSNTEDPAKYEKPISENGPTSTIDSITSQNDDRSNTAPKSSCLPEQSDTSHVSDHYYGSESVPHALGNTQNDNFSESDFLQNSSRQGENNLENPELNYQTGFKFNQLTDYSVDNGNSSIEKGDGGHIGSRVFSSNASHSISYGYDKDFNSSTSFSNTNVISNDVAKAYTDGIVTNVSHRESEPRTNFSAFAPKLGNSYLESKNHSSLGLDERNPSNSSVNLASFKSQRTSDSFLTSSNSNSGGLFDGPTFSTANESYTRKSRPSFLDSLNIKDSSFSSPSFDDNDKIVNSKLSTLNPSDDFLGNASKGHKSFEQSLESNLEFASKKQNDDFAALEQHIEDLTQEKFSLQRALEASKVLAESLASENSSLTESYNQQASTVSQLKAEMERLQEEIKARLVELEAIKAEYMNAQLECNAADERAKLLASEVISLEEKALRLRSSELKLERELENSSAEIASYKKNISALDKERRELLQTIDALQEEKKVLQSKLRRASTSGISIDLNKGHTKKDASTTTSDLGLDTFGDNSGQTSASMQMVDNVDNFQLLQNIYDNQENFASIIPPDQVQMIQNINSLISEISSEKEELMQALITEVSTSTKLKELNKELSHKLEVQTQRLELLSAQSMASQLVTPNPNSSSEIQHESVVYADEGDEVVERVLGWIMKMFPGGPSKRRTRRL